MFVLKSFDSPLLCEGETLEELKTNLENEVALYHLCLSEYNEIEDDIVLNEQFVNDHPDICDDDILEELFDRSDSKYEELADHLSDLRYTEECIKEIEPDFVSSLPIQEDLEGL